MQCLVISISLLINWGHRGRRHIQHFKHTLLQPGMQHTNTARAHVLGAFNSDWLQGAKISSTAVAWKILPLQPVSHLLPYMSAHQSWICCEQLPLLSPLSQRLTCILWISIFMAGISPSPVTESTAARISLVSWIFFSHSMIWCLQGQKGKSVP